VAVAKSGLQHVGHDGASRELLGTATDEGLLLFNLLDDHVTEDLEHHPFKRNRLDG
jgi:hypothetical protein